MEKWRRFELAWIIANSKNNEIILYDEFTSVVNRDSAKSLSYSLQRYIIEHNLKNNFSILSF